MRPRSSNPLTYDELRPRIKSGDLLAWSTVPVKTWRDAVLVGVRFATMSEYVHVGAAYVDGDRVFVAEATPPEVRIYPLSKLTPFYYMALNIDWGEDLKAFLFSHLGEEYSIWECIRSYFGKPKNDNQWQCAEYMKEFYSLAGFDLGDAYRPNTLIHAMLEQNESGLIYVPF